MPALYAQLTDEECAMKARQLINEGWHRCSNKYRIIVRIPRPDWRQVVADHWGRHKSEADPSRTDGEIWVEQVGDKVTASIARDILAKRGDFDSYRDNVDLRVYRLLPHSNHSPVGYRKLEKGR